ncbi:MULTISPECIES: helix-turn-helix domain-containing protein [Kribbella]|jgi:transcriptional regulator with XRE-family HTH domain|uniref:XRE family transcriptional regulator n=2 Tax=Kribbella TaxID=182639 RepID=A0ABY2F546_9ACTN|nr:MULTISPECIES: helix-turn-helix transcriptional regulator [Kribbella]TCC22069.1 XRE family transcriptional regulator [Kribbella speibonae]TDO54096.1 helix-turn-helix protein [Kribbella sp. VKM Ac-2571]TDW81525.1 XRE family transcriptional regulator [Kribbella pratensis]TDW83652.1 XRE family transcriptional regulator [Kribbella sp. VKM Ac-2566]
MANDEDVLESVGPRLRALRTERGTTLAQLSETTGISVSTLSRLESGQRRPTLELLLPLARAHQVQLDELVDAPPTGDPRIYQKPIKRHGTIHVPLSRRPGGLQAFKQILPAGYPGNDVVQKTHEGYDWFYVLSGRIRLKLGDQDFIVKEGEAVEFDCRVPHWFSNPGPGPTEVLCLYGPQGERMHVRARTT